MWLACLTATARQDSLTAVFTLPHTQIRQDMSANEQSISLATRKEQPLEEAPSIVSVVTATDIERTGARDLTDVLRLLPGFEFGIDVQQIVGMGFRGIWAHEGKALIMLNGLMINDLGYGNTNHIGFLPASLIERVEIIRGPGSVLYGGFAGVGVINVVTRKGEQLKGGEVELRAGSVGRLLHGHGHIALGTTWKGIRMSVTGGMHHRPLSAREYRDFAGNRLEPTQSNYGRDYHWIAADLSYKNVQFRYHRTSQNYTGDDAYTHILTRTYPDIPVFALNHTTENALLSYRQKIHPRISIEPVIELSTGNNISTARMPVIGQPTYGTNTGVRLWRLKGEIIANVSLGKAGELNVGAGGFEDVARVLLPDGTPGMRNSFATGDTTRRTYQVIQSGYLLAQYALRIGQFGLSAGIRREMSAFGQVNAPRTGLTWHNGRWNVKLLAGAAFRLPTTFTAYSGELDNTSLLKPETSFTYEAEIGSKLSRTLHWRANGYFVQIFSPILYLGNENRYANLEDILASQGLEAELIWKDSRYGGFLNMAWTRPVAGAASAYLAENRSHFLGLPTVKLNGGGHIRYQNWTFSTTLSWLGSRYAQRAANALDPADLPTVELYPALLMADLHLAYDFVDSRSSLSFSIHNLHNAPYVLIQPYYGGHAPMPAFDRQITLGWKVKF